MNDFLQLVREQQVPAHKKKKKAYILWNTFLDISALYIRY